MIDDKRFVFGNYEVRRFPAGQTVTHIVPTDSLRAGSLKFQDCAQGFTALPDGTQVCKGGNINAYDLASSSLCGPGGTTACDPRHIGISPTLQTLFNLNPAGNDPNGFGADGQNTTGFRSSVTTPIKNDFVTTRLDHNFTDRVHFFGKYIYSRNLQVTPLQINTLNNQTIATSGTNIRGDGAIGSLDWTF